MELDDDGDGGVGAQRWGTTTSKVDARRRYESRRAKRNAFSGRGRGRGRGGALTATKTTAFAVGSDDVSGRDVDALEDANEERGRRRGGGRADAFDSALERGMDVERGADLEALLRDAQFACLPRQRSDATYFDVEWTVDALRKMERESGVGARNGEEGAAAPSLSSSSANLLVLDADALANYLSDASLATLLGLPEAYEDECGRDGSPFERGHQKMLEKRVTAETAPAVVPVPQNAIEKEVGPAATTKLGADDDWLDELLADES